MFPALPSLRGRVTPRPGPGPQGYASMPVSPTLPASIVMARQLSQPLHLGKSTTLDRHPVSSEKGRARRPTSAAGPLGKEGNPPGETATVCTFRRGCPGALEFVRRVPGRESTPATGLRSAQRRPLQLRPAVPVEPRKRTCRPCGPSVSGITTSVVISGVTTPSSFLPGTRRAAFRIWVAYVSSTQSTMQRWTHRRRATAHLRSFYSGRSRLRGRASHRIS